MYHEPVPFLDLITPHEILRDELMSVLSDAIATGHYVGGKTVDNFETEFASFCEASFCVGVNSGTDALRFALMASIAPGTIVLTVPNTFIATTEAISQAEAIPYFVDIDTKTFNMDSSALARFLATECFIDEKRDGHTIHRKSDTIVSAIVPVHLYGQCADMDSLQSIAMLYNLIILEDACQAHGSKYYSQKKGNWFKAGTMSAAAAFSFYPGKNLGALGEGGAVITNNAALAEKVRLLREHGSKTKYYHPIEGYNGRLDALQAGFLSKKLPYLADWNFRRHQHAGYYNEILATIPQISTPFEPSWSRSNYHLYVIKTEERDNLQRHLTEQNIATGLHYPLPLHLQEAYRHHNYREGDFPVAEAVAKQILSLPMFPTLQPEQQDRVAEAIREFFYTEDTVYQPARIEEYAY